MLRHAKSDWTTNTSDHDRPLNARGRSAAAAVGIVLARSGEIPDLAVASSALRARSTLEIAAQTGNWPTEISVDPSLYGTSAAGALAVVAATDGDVQRLMVVGHQPTWGTLVRTLTGASVVVKTATVVAIDLSATSWRKGPEARGSICYMLQPRLFTDGSWDLEPV